MPVLAGHQNPSDGLKRNTCQQKAEYRGNDGTGDWYGACKKPAATFVALRDGVRDESLPPYILSQRGIYLCRDCFEGWMREFELARSRVSKV